MTNGLVRGRVTDCGAMRDHGGKGGALTSAAVEIVVLNCPKLEVKNPTRVAFLSWI